MARGHSATSYDWRSARVRESTRETFLKPREVERSGTIMSGSIGMSRVSSRRSSIAAYFYSEHKYRLMKTLGLGAFSKVKLAVHTPTGQKVAIKIMNRHKMRDVEEKGRDPPHLTLQLNLISVLVKIVCVCCVVF